MCIVWLLCCKVYWLAEMTKVVCGCTMSSPFCIAAALLESCHIHESVHSMFCILFCLFYMFLCVKVISGLSLVQCWYWLGDRKGIRVVFITDSLKVICNGFSQNWWKVVSSCLLQYKPIYVKFFDKLRCKMLKSKRLVVFLYRYSSAHRHAWRHIRMCLFLFVLLLRLDKKLFYPFSLLKSLSVWQKCYI